MNGDTYHLHGIVSDALEMADMLIRATTPDERE